MCTGSTSQWLSFTGVIEVEVPILVLSHRSFSGQLSILRRRVLSQNLPTAALEIDAHGTRRQKLEMRLLQSRLCAARQLPQTSKERAQRHERVDRQFAQGESHRRQSRTRGRLSTNAKAGLLIVTIIRR